MSEPCWPTKQICIKIHMDSTTVKSAEICISQLKFFLTMKLLETKTNRQNAVKRKQLYH